MRLSRGAVLLLLPAILVFGVLLVGPLLDIVQESFREFVPGRVGSAAGSALTLANYTELGQPAYLTYFADTFRISLIATAIGLAVAFPIAHHVARRRSPGIRKLWIGFLIAMMFLSVVVRVYALALTFGPIGFLGAITRFLGANMAGKPVTEALVIAGLLHYLIPIIALTLIGTIQNVNPALAEAAQSLGAPRWAAHLSVTVPLSARGILSAFLIGYTLSISAFVIPLILGRGRVLFVSNLIFSRFSEVADYPSGAALSVVMLALSLFIIYVVSRLAIARWEAR
jgi:ABC-type spermidine/putrescine transport system permease subunit I